LGNGSRIFEGARASEIGGLMGGDLLSMTNIGFRSEIWGRVLLWSLRTMLLDSCRRIIRRSIKRKKERRR